MGRNICKMRGAGIEKLTGSSLLAQDTFPIPKDCEYWMHREGTLWALQAGRGVDHLWVWYGQNPELLQEGFDSRTF